MAGVRHRPQRPVQVRPREELAWAAGFADGEGSFFLERTYPAPFPKQPAFGLVQVNPQVLQRFANVMGFGKVVGPYGPYKKSKFAQPLYSWRARGFERMQAVTALLWPFLSPVKRDQARHMLVTYLMGES